MAKASALREAGNDEENITRPTIDEAAPNAGYSYEEVSNKFW